MTKEEKSKLVIKFFEAINKNDFSGLENHAIENVKLDFPGVKTLDGFKRVTIFLKTLVRKYPGLTFTIHDTIVDENKACVVWTNRANEVNGEKYENAGITLFYIEEDKIVYLSDYFKDTSFVQ